MPSASHSAWLARTRATVAAIVSGESTSIEPTTSPFAGLRTSICSAVAVAPLAPLVVP